MVKSGDLDNREGVRGLAESEAAIRKMKGKPEADAAPTAEQALADLKARIAQARALPTPHSAIADGRSWAMGRDAALAVIDGG
jgi:hypothetical protein